MKILMFHGRAGGHNILPFLEYFNSSEEHELTFIYSNDRSYFPPENRIRFEHFSFKPWRLLQLSKLIRQDYDLIWYHGGHSALILYFFSLLRSRRSTFIFNVWNEWLIRRAAKGGLRGYFFQTGIRQADVIHCNWHGTAEVLRQTGWNDHIKVFYWGLHEENFRSYQNPATEEASQFIASLPKGKTKFFFPKSISPNSRHDLVIQAAANLREAGLHDFIVYFWLGNTNQPELMDSLQAQIDAAGLAEHVILQKHGFLPFSDMQLIWRAMDAGLQIAANEQLSTTFLEPMFYRKPLIVTDIRPYQLYQETFGADIIELTALQTEAITEKMQRLVRGELPDQKILEKRHRVVAENFNLKQNIANIVDHYQKQKRA